jgi:hypothetical protein
MLPNNVVNFVVFLYNFVAIVLQSVELFPFPFQRFSQTLTLNSGAAGHLPQFIHLFDLILEFSFQLLIPGFLFFCIPLLLF